MYHLSGSVYLVAGMMGLVLSCIAPSHPRDRTIRFLGGNASFPKSKGRPRRMPQRKTAPSGAARNQKGRPFRAGPLRRTALVVVLRAFGDSAVITRNAANRGPHTLVSIPSHRTVSHRTASRRIASRRIAIHRTANHRSSDATSSDGATTRRHHASVPDILSNELGHRSRRARTQAQSR